jgi:hypothetical protein
MIAALTGIGLSAAAGLNASAPWIPRLRGLAWMRRRAGRTCCGIRWPPLLGISRS